MKKSIYFLLFFLFCICFTAYTQESFNRTEKDKKYKSGTNKEFWKNGNLKSESTYQRKYKWFYTTTTWEIKEYNMEGKLVRIINKIIETSRKDNKEKIVKEEVFRFPDEKDNTVRPLEGGGTENP